MVELNLRDRSKSPTLRIAAYHPMYHGVSEGLIIPSTQGFEPDVPGLELVTASRLTVLQPH
eukprot:6298243-Prorocentrum_lima.AAC.1